MLIFNIALNLHQIYEIYSAAIPTSTLLLSTDFKMIDIIMMTIFVFTILCTCLIMLIYFVKRKEIFKLFLQIEFLDEQVS